jgi:hypothetical protein
MTRKECWGSKEDHSDQCDFYDEEGFCHYYGDSWEGDDGVFRGGEDVKLVTYCTQRIIKGKRINDSMNPLHMERLCRYNEVIFNGEIRMRHNEVYNPSGIICWGGDDPRMEDPVTGMIQYPDGRMETTQERWERENADVLKSLNKKLRVCEYVARN